MDQAWTWGALLALVIMVAGAMAGFIPGVIDRAPRLGWWLMIFSPLPLVVWNILWVVMANPPDGTRRGLSVVIGAIAGAAILLGATELIRGGNAEAQSAGTEQKPMPSDNRRGNFSEGQRGGNNSQTYIEQRLPQRHIERDKIKQLTEALATKQIPIIVVQLGDIEANTYGTDFLTAVRNAKIKWDFVSVGSLSPPPYGVLVGPKSDNAIVVRELLLQAGVNATLTERTPPMPASADRPDYVKIVVGLQDPRQ